MPRRSAQALATVSMDAIPENFLDYKGSGDGARPDNTFMNALIALRKLGLDGRYNIFRNEFLLGSETLILNQETGELSDLACLSLRQLIRQQFGFEPSAQNMQDAATRFCTMKTFHPIKVYFAGLPAWDGTPRVDRLLCDYFSAPDTPFNAAVSRIVLMASVRRILQPGAKFDYMTVLQSEEGYNKSSAISALYGEENYSAETIIGKNSQALEETVRGVWALENAELDGISKVEWGKLKNGLSKQSDRVRRAFGRNPINSKRTVIQWGTTNDETYLRALSGENRRFFSVDVLGMINVEKIIADRDQIWAEACLLEATGESVALAPEFWLAAREARVSRTQDDPWQDILADVSDAGAEDVREAAQFNKPLVYELDRFGWERVASGFVLAHLGLSSKDLQPHHASRAARVMRSLGWQYAPGGVRIGGKNVRGYMRDTLADLM
jgi:hypothetical protein